MARVRAPRRRGHARDGPGDLAAEPGRARLLGHRPRAHLSRGCAHPGPRPRGVIPSLHGADVLARTSRRRHRDDPSAVTPRVMLETDAETRRLRHPAGAPPPRAPVGTPRIVAVPLLPLNAR